MADWALSWKIADVHGDMASWGLKNGSDKHNRIIDDFIAMTYGIESCATAADGSMRVVENKNSRYYGDTLYCKNGLLNEYYAFLIDNEHVYGTVTSTSGNTYRTVVINGLEIMAENMRDEVSGRWFNLQFVNGDSDFTDPYGFLYEIVSASGICPVRWRLPSKDEMDALIAYVGSENVIASKHLRVSVWADGDNQTGFNGLPAGVLTKDHDYIGFDSFGVWWTGTRDEENECNYAMMLTEDGVSLVCTTEYAYASVRCIKDYE